MKWSWKVGRFLGIGVYIHVTFLLVVLMAMSGQNTLTEGLWSLAFVLALFGCVTLHEFGHALAARGYGIETKDITLYPIGGVASLERMPTNPWHELFITLAGPAVNVVIFALLYVVVRLTQPQVWDDASKIGPDTFLRLLMFGNLALVVFNMIPAFPMDGGRVLRSILALLLGYSTGTKVATIVGALMGVLFVYAGFAVVGNVMLSIIGALVVLACIGEYTKVSQGSSFGESFEAVAKGSDGKDRWGA